MPVPQDLQDLLQDYLNNVTGSDQKIKEEKKKQLRALNATTREQLVQQASKFVENGDECPSGWVKCMGGFCAPTPGDCGSMGISDRKPKPKPVG